MSSLNQSTKLCIVVPADHKNQLEILGQVQDGIIVSAKTSPLRSTILSLNRPTYTPLRQEEQDIPLGTIGFWKKTDTSVKSVSSFEDMSILKGNLTYQNSILPRRIFILPKAKSSLDVRRYLQSGITEPLYNCDTIFCFAKMSGYYSGWLCNFNKFNFQDGKYYLNVNFDALTNLSFTEDKLFYAPNDLIFFKSTPVDDDEQPNNDQNDQGKASHQNTSQPAQNNVVKKPEPVQEKVQESKQSPALTPYAKPEPAHKIEQAPSQEATQDIAQNISKSQEQTQNNDNVQKLDLAQEQSQYSNDTPDQDTELEQAQDFEPELSSEKQLELQKEQDNIILDTLLYRIDSMASSSKIRDCKELIQRVIDEGHIYGEVAQHLNCSVAYAKKAVTKLAQQSQDLLSHKNIEASFLAQIIQNNDSLRHQFERAFKEQWEAVNKDQLLITKDELQNYQDEIAKLKTEYQDLATQKLSLQQAISDSQAKAFNHDQILITKDELQKYQDKLSQIQTEYQKLESQKLSLQQEISDYRTQKEKLTQSIQEYEDIALELDLSTQEQLDVSQKEPISESVPDSQVNTSVTESQTVPSTPVASASAFELVSTNHWSLCPGQLYIQADHDFIEYCSDWSDVCEVLRQNLINAGISDDFSELFTYFIYSAYINKLPIMLAGPNGYGIANAISVSLQRTTIPLLKCHGEMNQGVLNTLTPDKIVAVENPFHPDWLSCMPQLTDNRFSIWLHPFSEDLALEPCSLWNYVFPVLTECLVDKPANLNNLILGSIQKPFTEFEANSNIRVKLNTLDSFGLNRLFKNRIQKVLANAKQMCHREDVSMEFLFALLPLSLLSHKTSVLAEAIASNANVMTGVRDELKRYCED